MSNKKQKTFLIIDAHALIHRAYHALPELTAPDGTVVNAVYGFTSVLIKVLREMQPDYVAAAFDLAGPTFRHEAYDEYKATRKKTDDTLVQQIPIVREVLAAFDIPVLEHAGFEADDVIGTVVAELKDKDDIRTVVATGDLDTLQLVRDDQVVVYTMRRGMGDTVVYNEEKVRERFGGLAPEQLVDFKGLKGDPSDNIPGVPGVGEKTAIALLSAYNNLEEIYEKFEDDENIRPHVKKKLKENREQAFFSRELATIRRDAPIAFSLSRARFTASVSEALTKKLSALGFTSLVRRIEGESLFQEEKQQNKQNDEHEEDTMFDSQYRQKLFSDRIYNLERALTPVLRRMEKHGVRIDTDVLSDINKRVTKELSSVASRVHTLAGEEFNLNSPGEVGRILFDVLDLGKRTKKTKTGAYSTRASELEKIADDHEIVPLVLRWRELSKLKSTYLETLPKLVDTNDRIHTTFKQLGAATGRLSSENPNLQNIPIRGEFGKEIRSAFIAPRGQRILAADYSQIELRIAASLSGDETMVSAFERGEDIHTRTAAEVFDVSMEKVTKDMRRQAKALNFGVLYGMGVHAFARSAEVSVEEAKRFIGAYRADFTGLMKYIEELKQKAYSHGYAETVWGRRRLLPELSSGNPGMRAAGERMAVNMPIQGTAADIIKAAMVSIDEEIRDKDDIVMILQVHDELVFEVQHDMVETYAPRIRETMENIIELTVSLTVDVEAGKSWGEMKEI